ncbi:MAG TPA: TonB family protein [Gallionella sp.]|nr:TonB family protein [Gallionella sp.]
MTKTVMLLTAALFGLVPLSSHAEYTYKQTGAAEQGMLSQCNMLKNGITVCSAYIEAVKVKIERIANLLRPASLKSNGRTSSVLLEFVIRADGSLASAAIMKSSGNPIFDEFSVRAVNQAAPFAPFPDAMARETAMIYVRRSLMLESHQP